MDKQKPNWDLWTFDKQALFMFMMQCGRTKEAEQYRDNVIYGRIGDTKIKEVT